MKQRSPRRDRTHKRQQAELSGLRDASLLEAEPAIAAQATRDRPLHVLFICSRNQWRSPTAEHLWRNQPGLATRSAGTRASARHRLNGDDVRWADVILVMEDKHKAEVQAAFATLLDGKRLLVLHIPDDYQYMDAELVSLLRQSVPPLLGLDQR